MASATGDPLFYIAEGGNLDLAGGYTRQVGSTDCGRAKKPITVAMLGVDHKLAQSRRLL